MAKKQPIVNQQVQRAARHLAKYLGDLLTTMREFMREAEPLRNRILTDIKALVEALPERDRGAVISAIAVSEGLRCSRFT
jgi:hypothetical protein